MSGNVQSTGAEGQIVLTASTTPVLNKYCIEKNILMPIQRYLYFNGYCYRKSSASDSQQENNPTTAGNDGNSSTRWCANDANTGHWWKVDLGANHNIYRGLRSIGNTENTYQYKIETSTDNSVWKTIGQQTSIQYQHKRWTIISLKQPGISV